MRFLAAFLFVFLSATAGWAKPNVLLIIADDMGLDASPCYDVGSDKAAMPNLSKLCASGVVYENAYTPPVCTPTRAAIMTGRYGFRTGVEGVGPGAKALSTSEVSIFDLMGEAGYANAVIGKWHVAKGNDYSHPFDLGVQDYYGMFSGGVKSYFDWSGVDNGKPIKVKEYATTHLTNRAIEFIGAQSNPWFLWLAYNAPHSPFQAPNDALHSVAGLSEGDTAKGRKGKPHFKASLEALDGEIGRLLGAMDAQTRANTVVIFIGDNGSPNAMTGGLYGDRGAKGSIFEGGTHVPLMISGPGIAVGRSDRLVNSTDLFATIAAVGGLQSGADDSVSLIGNQRRAFAYVGHMSGDSKRKRQVSGWMIRNDRFKLVEVKGGERYLFDLKTDPFEKRNLLSSALDATQEQALTSLQTAVTTLRN